MIMNKIFLASLYKDLYFAENHCPHPDQPSMEASGMSLCWISILICRLGNSELKCKDTSDLTLVSKLNGF